MSSCVLIIAPPRHGTSLVGGVLDALGYRMAPDEFRIGLPNEANPKGFFNDTEFEWFCTELYGSYFPAAAVDLTDEQKHRLKSMVAERQAAERWGLKEWRVSLFMPELLRLIGDCKSIRLTRGLERAVESWNRHFGERIQRATVGDFQRATSFIDAAMPSGVPALTIDYDAAHDDPRGTVDGIAHFLGVEPNSKAVEFIDNALRRH